MRNSGKFRLELRHVTLAAVITLYILMVTGGMVRVAEAGGACPDWPTCFGGWTPPPAETPSGVRALIDYGHRLATFLSAPLVLAAAGLARKRARKDRWVIRLLDASAVLVLVQIVLGAFIALQGAQLDQNWVTAGHLMLSLLALGASSFAAVVSFYQAVRGEDEQPARLQFRSPFARLSLLTLGVVFLLLVSGGIVAGTGTGSACQSWPLCDQGLIPEDSGGWINLAHRMVVLAAAGLVGALFVNAWRSQRSQTTILVATTAFTVLFFAQALLGAKLVQGFPIHLLGLHEATAVAVWAALVVQVTAVGLAGRSAEDEAAEAAEMAAARQPGNGKRRLLDFLLLTKPIVVLLLLVTTYAGMVIGAQAFPSLGVTLWTLLGGFMAAGGSGAINQYIDREDDLKMQRTQKRPIPSGRLTPGEGLAFGVGIALASFYLMVAFVNFIAALLSLAGIIYYVLLYSIFLKKTTVQNIVIGGGAGAIPPLVGWAAATGGLNIPSLFLFAVVFMWTPPHFWALALVRRKDYARAGVPMLPVVRGEEETRKQIFIYTLELVGLTLLLPLAGLGGAVYAVLAAALGGWLLYAAWKVWKQGGNKLAWKMYRYSSMYLAFLFFALMIDRLL